MFIRLIGAEAADREELRRLWGSGPDGWLESTGGVTAAGRWLVAVRYSSDEAARRNENRPDYQKWWNEIEAHLAAQALQRPTSLGQPTHPPGDFEFHPGNRGRTPR